jgi:type IX secretion system substrate protein
MKTLYILIALLMLGVSTELMAQKDNQILRQATGTYDLQKNTVSNFEFYTSNFGIFGFNTETGKGEGFWPRGTQNLYHFAGGFWFGAQKEVNNEMKKLVTISYNPNNGKGWFVPGRIEDGFPVDESEKEKYRLYFSTDFNEETGEVNNADDGPNWPYWITDNVLKYEYGVFKHEYIYDEANRNLTSYPQGPLFVSDEDIVSTYKDTDLSRYNGGAAAREAQGYPLGLQVDSKVFSWGEGDQEDVVVHMYVIENKSNDILKNCWFAGICDTDIGYYPDGYKFAKNDHVRYYSEDPSLNLCVAWTDTDQGEEGKGFGYMGYSLLESPAVDDQGFIRTDKHIFELDEQLGLITMANWTIENDYNEDVERYDFISSGIRDGDTGPGDKRINASTGPFNMRPGDKARIVVAYSFAMPAKGGEADGTTEDLTGFDGGIIEKGSQVITTKSNSLIGKLENARDAYYVELISSVNDYIAPSLSIQKVYPNPVKNNFTIDFTNETPGFAEICLYDLSGNKIMNLMNGPIESKRHILDFSIENSNLEDGMYILNLKIGGSSLSEKIVIMK